MIPMKMKESFRRLYLAGSDKVTLDKMNEMLAEGTITEEEYAEITAPDDIPVEDEYKQYYETVNAAILGGE
ncbi:hypothetical protein [Paenibacillus sp.]